MTETTPQANNGSNGMAIASMVLAIVGGLLTLTVIGGIIGIPAMVIALILGIISLATKKPGKGMAIVGVLISAIAFISMIIVAFFVGNKVKQYAQPMIEFTQEMEKLQKEDPEIVELMKNPEFAEKVNDLMEEKLEDANIDEDNIGADNFSDVLDTVLDSYKDALLELKEEYKDK